MNKFIWSVNFPDGATRFYVKKLELKRLQSFNTQFKWGLSDSQMSEVIESQTRAPFANSREVNAYLALKMYSIGDTPERFHKMFPNLDFSQESLQILLKRWSEENKQKLEKYEEFLKDDAKTGGRLKVFMLECNNRRVFLAPGVAYDWQSVWSWFQERFDNARLVKDVKSGEAYEVWLVGLCDTKDDQIMLREELKDGLREPTLLELIHRREK